jgi:hypothetical protein
MKKLLVLAMVLVLAAPMFAEMSIGGEFDYYMVNGFDSDNGASFADKWDKGEVDFKGTIGDYSQIRIELEDDQNWNDKTGAEVPNGTPRFNYFRVITDWGKMFGLDGIGIKTDIGLNDYGTFDNVDFTGFNYENADSSAMENPALDKDFGFQISLSFVDGLVQPYFNMNFDTVAEEDNEGTPTPDGEAQFIIGSGFDFNALGLPLWVEAYFFKEAVEDNNMFGIEAMYDLAISDMNFKIGGFLLSASNGDDRGEEWGLGIGFNAFGATINVSGGGEFGEDFYGKDNYSAFEVLGIDASYDILDWLAVNAGVGFRFGDYKDSLGDGDKAFQSFEAGVVVKPDKGVKYKLGYIYCDEDVAANKGRKFRTLNTKKVTAEKGGLYFVTQIDF